MVSVRLRHQEFFLALLASALLLGGCDRSAETSDESV